MQTFKNDRSLIIQLMMIYYNLIYMVKLLCASAAGTNMETPRDMRQHLRN